MSIFGERLAQLLHEKGITQAELSKKANTTNATISRYINGDREPRAEIATDIAKILNTNTDYLFGKTDNASAIDADYPISEEEWKNTPVALSAPEGYDALTEEGKRQIMELIKILPKKTDK